MNESTAERMAFIGAGNMAEALVRGILQNGRCTPDRMVAADPSAARLARFRETYGVETTADNPAAIREADVVVLAVKPQVMDEVLAGLRPSDASGPLWISIAAGVPIGRIEAGLGGSARVVRAMPNTPALVGAGITAICAGAHASPDDLARAERLLTAVGRVVRTQESHMDAVTAISGSGPAYLFYFAEAWLRAARALDLPEETARALVLDTFTGAARLMAESKQEPETLRRNVTSPGGTTEAALRVLDEHDVGQAFEAAIRAAARRARELSGVPDEPGR